MNKNEYTPNMLNVLAGEEDDTEVLSAMYTLQLLLEVLPLTPVTEQSLNRTNEELVTIRELPNANPLFTLKVKMYPTEVEYIITEFNSGRQATEESGIIVCYPHGTFMRGNYLRDSETDPLNHLSAYLHSDDLIVTVQKGDGSSVTKLWSQLTN